MSSDFVDNALGRRADTQHRQTAGVNLGSSSILDHLGRDAQAARLLHQLLDLVEALGLHGDLGLAEALPACEEPGGVAVGSGLAGLVGEGLVAGEGRVGALGGDFTWLWGCEWVS